MEKIKAVIFDMDGVIFDTEKIWQKAYLYANKRYNVKISEKLRQKFCGLKRREQIEIISQNYPREIAEKYVRFAHFFCFLAKEIAPLKRGFCELVKFLKSKNIKIALATGSHLNRVEILFNSNNMKIGDIFDAVATSDDVSHGKPNPEIYNFVLNKLGEKPKNCLVLEDSINGILAATSAKIPTIMVQDIIKPSKDVKNLCLKIFKNLNQVQKFLEQQI